MAQLYSSVASGNWSAAATWGKVTNTPTIHASTNISVTTSNFFSATFTAPSLTDQSVGCWIYITTKASTLPTLTLTLQENSIDTTAVGTFDTSTLTANGALVYFKFGIPFTFTSVAAGYYRLKLTSSSATATTVAADSGGANFHYYAVDSRTGTPGSTDQVLIGGDVSTTVTVDGTQTVGNGGTVLNTQRTIQDAVKCVWGGILKWDTTASTTLNCNGCFQIYSNGEMQAGTVATPYPDAYVAKLIFTPGASGDYGTAVYNGGRKQLHGMIKPFQTTYASGSGTAADPMITGANIGDVNDEIVITPSTDQASLSGRTQYKFIITKNSDTSYVLSNTLGGAENALTTSYLSTNSEVLNLERNVIITTDNTTKMWYQNRQESQTPGDFDIDYVRLENVGMSGADKRAYSLSYSATSTVYSNADNVVMYRTGFNGFQFYGVVNPNTYSNLITTGKYSSGGGTGYFMFSVTDHTFNNFYALDSLGNGFDLTVPYATFNNCKAIGVGVSGLGYGGFKMSNSPGAVFVDCEAHLTFSSLIHFVNGDYGTWTRFLSNTKGNHTNASSGDIRFGNAGFASYKDCTFHHYGTSRFITNNTDAGFDIRFHNLNTTTYKHENYTTTGIMSSAGPGLTDTTVRTAGNYTLRFSPWTTTGYLTYTFQILAKASSAVSCLGFLKKNAAFVAASGVVIAELYLPGSTSPDATQTMSLDTNWNVFNLFANYTGAVSAFATVKIKVQCNTASAYVYLADIFNGTNDITNLKTWEDALPSEIMFEQLGDANAVWAVATATQTIAGTMGKQAVQTNTLVKNLQALIAKLF